MLLPHLGAVVIDGISRVAGAVEVRARPRASDATCPSCGKRSDRVHGRYERALADAAIAGQRVRIRLQVRRFKCMETSCARATFVEQVDGLTMRYGRRSQLLGTMLATIGLALAGRAGARLADRLGLATRVTPCCASCGRCRIVLSVWCRRSASTYPDPVIIPIMVDRYGVIGCAAGCLGSVVVVCVGIFRGFPGRRVGRLVAGTGQVSR